MIWLIRSLVKPPKRARSAQSRASPQRSISRNCMASARTCVIRGSRPHATIGARCTAARGAGCIWNLLSTALFFCILAKTPDAARSEADRHRASSAVITDLVDKRVHELLLIPGRHVIPERVELVQ